MWSGNFYLDLRQKQDRAFAVCYSHQLFPLCPTPTLWAEKGQHFIFPVSLGSSAVIPCTAGNLVRGFWTRTFSHTKEEMLIWKVMPTWHPLLPAFKHSVCEPDGWSSGSQIVIKRQQISKLKMAEQTENAKPRNLQTFQSHRTHPRTSVLQLLDK